MNPDATTSTAQVADVAATPDGTESAPNRATAHVQRRGIVYLQFALLIGTLAVWEWISRTFETGFWISSPSAVAVEMLRWYKSGELLADLKITLFEAGVGFMPQLR